MNLECCKVFFGISKFVFLKGAHARGEPGIFWLSYIFSLKQRFRLFTFKVRFPVDNKVSLHELVEDVRVQKSKLGLGLEHRSLKHVHVAHTMLRTVDA